ncbi:MAG: DUF1622 domain-containing protein [Enterobacteriaceae bacterium]|jgi:uncharacterized membrane protein|nr:DUF1622 domain-containing protein [Enterobacteriaceae bacterium]
MVNIFIFIANILSVIAIFIISYGTVITAIRFIFREITRNPVSLNRTFKDIRASLMAYLLLAMEILIAANILKIILRPNDQTLIILGTLVAIRTIMACFPNRENKESARQEKSAEAAAAAAQESADDQYHVLSQTN